MFVVLTALTLSIADRSGRWIWKLRPADRPGWLLVLVLPWFVAIVAKSGDSFFEQSVGEDMLSKVFGGQEAHGAPPGFYFLLFWVTFWPGSVLAGLAAPMDVAGAARAGRAISAGLADSVLDRCSKR